MKTKKFSKASLKAEIVKEFGTVTELKKHLKKTAVYQYGCYTSEIKLYGCRIFYTSNPNHFCSFGISIPLTGSNNTLGLGKTSITKAGKQRGCSKYHITL